MADTFLIGSGSAFSGDRLDAPRPVLDTLIARGGPSVLMFETLGERTLALAQLSRRDDPAHGYEPALIDLLRPVLAGALEHGIPIVGNFGAANPVAAGRAIRRLSRELGCGEILVAVVLGDDVRESLGSGTLEPWETDDLGLLADSDIVAANAYLGAAPIAAALGGGAQVVVTGRVTDSALALGPLIQHFGWKSDDWNRLAAGVLTGHLLECGAQVTGGYFADPGWKDVPGLADVGFPLAEVDASGGIIITKADNTGGCVTPQTVKEQMLYEIHDPTCYLTPDVALDLSDVTVEAIGRNRVRVAGARGYPPTDRLKVTVSYQGDWLGEAEISYAGPNAFRRARLATEIVRERVSRYLAPGSYRTEIIGAVSLFDDDTGTFQAAMADSKDGDRWGRDFRMRLAAHAPDRAIAEQVIREVLSLYCAGPAGGGGVRQRLSRRMNTLSCLIPCDSVDARVEFLEVDE